LAQYIGEVRKTIAEFFYISNINTNENARKEEPRVKEYLTYANIGAYKHKRKYLYKSVTKIDPFSRITSVTPLPSEILRMIPNFVRLRIKLRRIQKEFGIVILLGLIVVRKID